MKNHIMKDENPQIRQIESLTAEAVFKVANALNDDEYYNFVELIITHNERVSKDIIFNHLRWK